VNLTGISHANCQALLHKPTRVLYVILAFIKWLIRQIILLPIHLVVTFRLLKQGTLKLYLLNAFTR
jgi:hypothetical protein